MSYTYNEAIVTNKKYYEEIAESIRSKVGTSATYKPAEMKAAIASFPIFSDSDLVRTFEELEAKIAAKESVIWCDPTMYLGDGTNDISGEITIDYDVNIHYLHGMVSFKTASTNPSAKLSLFNCDILTSVAGNIFFEGCNFEAYDTKFQLCGPSSLLFHQYTLDSSIILDNCDIEYTLQVDYSLGGNREISSKLFGIDTTTNGTVVIKNSHIRHFWNNESNKYSVFASSNSNIVYTIENTIIEGCHALSAGVMYITAGTATFKNCLIKDCYCSGTPANDNINAGGAIHIDGGANIVLNSTQIINCTSTGHGGAIINSGTLIMQNSKISNCISKGFGGAICNLGTLNMSNSTLEGNSSRNCTSENNIYASLGRIGRGGAIYNIGTINITGGYIINNHADYSGGGVHQDAGSTICSSSPLVVFLGNTCAMQYSASFGHLPAGRDIYTGTANTFQISAKTISQDSGVYPMTIYIYNDNSEASGNGWRIPKAYVGGVLLPPGGYVYLTN